MGLLLENHTDQHQPGTNHWRKWMFRWHSFGGPIAQYILKDVCNCEQFQYTVGPGTIMTEQLLFLLILTCVCLQSRQNWWWNRASSSQSGTWTELPGGGRSSWAQGMPKTGMKGRWLKRRTLLLGSCGLSAWHWWREEKQSDYSSGIALMYDMHKLQDNQPF